MKIIRCLAIEAIGPKVRKIRFRRLTLTWTQGKFLLFVAQETLPLMPIDNPEYDFDVILIRRTRSA